MEGMEYLQQNGDNIDLVLTDPPYIISHENWNG